MFGNKKNTTKYSDDILYTLEDEPIFNRSTGAFLAPFDETQKKILLLLMDHKVSVITFAYPTLPSQFYKAIQEAVLPLNPGTGDYVSYPFDEAILYRIVHTNMNLDQFNDCLLGMMNGIDMCKEIKNISQYPHEILNKVATMSIYGFNMCQDLDPDMDIEEFSLKVQSNMQKYRKKIYKEDKKTEGLFKLFRI